MSTVGPIARTVGDLALLYPILAGPDGRDTEVPPVPVELIPDRDLAGARIAFAPTLPGRPVAAAIRDALAALAGDLARAGAIVEEAALPACDVGEDLASAGALIGMMLGAFGPGAGERPAALTAYLAALDRRDTVILAWERFFEGWDALLCPVAMTTAFPHCAPGAPIRVDGRDESY